MPFIKFESKKEHKKAFRLWFENVSKPLEERMHWEPVTALQGKEEGLHNGVFIYSSKILEIFDKHKVKYEVLRKDELSKYLSESGLDYLSDWRKINPN